MVIAGIDEAGRGPLAGPVVAAAVVLDPYEHIAGLNDSKKLTAAVRARLFDQISECAASFGIGIATPAEIDDINILQATLLAMRRAFGALDMVVDEVWVDGISDPGLSVPTHLLVQGDSKVPEISAASILAKVTRDRTMEALAIEFPGYGFETNKGYPTAMHREQLQALGPCPIHRRSFSPVQDAIGLF